MNRLRWGLGALGLVPILYGAWLVLSRQEGFARLASVALWLAGGAIVHDLLIAPLVIAVAWALRGLPVAWKRPILVAGVVLGSLSLLAIPVLGHLGARSDNPTLLDRPYDRSWVVLAVVMGALVVAAGVVGSRRSTATVTPAAAPGPDDGGADGDGAGRR